MGQNAFKRLGQNIAKGNLTTEDGVSSNIDKNPQFNSKDSKITRTAKSGKFVNKKTPKKKSGNPTRKPES